MAELVLMERGAEQLYVHPAQVEQYAKDGWSEISRKALPAEMQPMEDQQVPEAELVARKPVKKTEAAVK